MIIKCRECNTGFDFNKNLLKESGSKVRCSICKHVFVAYPPVSTEEPAGPDKLIEAVPGPESEQAAQYVDIPKEDQDLKMLHLPFSQLQFGPLSVRVFKACPPRLPRP